ncbi:hypothetical protein [Cryptosporangium phraense]|uniref:Uncharacterized protein n=1 Tax=Cryptosporangium phraense TaxID=2593070 RepID=A0A545AYD1_9ACTN|nr:hypothetical protein [Cryptosporangium phraense]TQS45585.1 hypothetical protein FL583_07590 [Cryptosporangium phraense]
MARGEDYRTVFEHSKPRFDLEKERRARLDAGMGEYLNALDVYPDARECLAELREAGYFVGIAGNQTVQLTDVSGHRPDETVAGIRLVAEEGQRHWR